MPSLPRPIAVWQYHRIHSSTQITSPMQPAFRLECLDDEGTFGQGNTLNQSAVESFLKNHVIGQLGFNEHEQSGAHATFINRAAKASGLTVHKIGEGHFYKYEDRYIGQVQSMITSLISHSAIQVCRSKHVTKKVLDAAGVRVPKGRVFNETELDQAISFFDSLTGAVVVKPDGGRGGKGITADIRSEDHFREAWDKASSTSTREISIIVEEFVSGMDIRVYVVDGEAVAATTRMPPFVVGDGESTLEELLTRKRAQRDRNRYLRRLPIVVDSSCITNAGFHTDQILRTGEIAILSSVVNMSQGGENVDITELLSDELAQIAVRAVKAIPGMLAGGVDFLTSSPETAEGAVVLEVNTSANISVHHLPAYGKSVDVGQKIVNAMIRQATN